ncbi:MAG: pyrroline-5-carboxylate reductase [Tannerella sp.]|jgi:pyrroline-5-carboxylate reductase|nr:pyrroline-5-carboxylate reductase [Tannerella sp.]
MKIAIIGAGNIGGAIARVLGKSHIIKSSDICCSDLSTDTLDKISEVNKDIRTTTDNMEAVKDADIVIVAVKPWIIESVITEIKDFMSYKKQIFVSIAAGVDFAKLCEYLKKEDGELPAVFRIIPNTAIEVKESVNMVSVYNATPEQTGTIKKIFDELGLTLIIGERFINAGTALSSCGIAYAFRYIRASIEGAVELGLSPELAKIIEMQTLKGAIALLDANNSHPEAEIDKVTTPGGITIKGLNAMEEAGFTNAVIKGLKASM